MLQRALRILKTCTPPVAILASAHLASAQPICNPDKPLSPAWQRAEQSGVYAMLMMGEGEGAERGRELTWELAHEPPLPRKWREAEQASVDAMILKGDVEGAFRARRLIWDTMIGAGWPTPTCPPSR